jgi:hypothetical protein
MKPLGGAGVFNFGRESLRKGAKLPSKSLSPESPMSPRGNRKSADFSKLSNHGAARLFSTGRENKDLTGGGNSSAIGKYAWHPTQGTPTDETLRTALATRDNQRMRNMAPTLLPDQAIVNRLPYGAAVLEVGVGEGKALRGLAAAVGEQNVTAVDNQAGPIKFHKESGEFSKAKFVEAQNFSDIPDPPQGKFTYMRMDNVSQYMAPEKVAEAFDFADKKLVDNGMMYVSYYPESKQLSEKGAQRHSTNDMVKMIPEGLHLHHILFYARDSKGEERKVPVDVEGYPMDEMNFDADIADRVKTAYKLGDFVEVRMEFLLLKKPTE